MKEDSTPRLDGARHVRFRLTDPQHADLDRNLSKVESGWAQARKALVRVQGVCHCGKRWGHLMDGVDVLLLDRAPYTARCWDDDRIWINLPLFGAEPDGGVGALIHEFGHRIWFQCLSEEQRARWAQSYKKVKERSTPRWGKCSGTVTEYACTSDLEDFAEVFEAMVLGTADAANRERWAEVCGCADGFCKRAAHKGPEPAASADRASRRHGDTAPLVTDAIRWKPFAGGAAQISQMPGGGPYAKSEDDRFVIWVHRSRHGDARRRYYVYHYNAVDYGMPSGRQKFTAVTVNRGGRWIADSSTNVKDVMAAVERWAKERPIHG